MNRLIPVLFLLMSFLLVAAPISSSQALQQEDKTPEATLQTYRLDNTAASDIIKVLETMLTNRPLRMQADVRSNAIFVYAEKEDHETVKKILAAVDNAPPAQPAPETVIFYVRHVPANQLAEVIPSIMPALTSDVRIAVDGSTNALIVSAESRDSLDMIEDLIAKLDRVPTSEPHREPTPCMVRVSWLIDLPENKTDEFQNALTETSASLKELAAQLKEDGTMVRPRLFSEILTTVSAGTQPGKFSNGTTKHLRNKRLQLAVSGELEKRATGNYMLQIELDFADRQAHPNAPNSLVSTALAIPLDHPVAFSVSDVDSVKSVIVVEVTEVPFK